VVLVSHAMSSMRTLCDSIAWLENGRLQGVGASGDLVDEYVDESHEDRVVDESGGTRWGDGQATVEKVELVDAQGVASTTFRTGAAVSIRLHYKADTRIPNPVFGYAVETVEGVYLWAHNSRDGGMVPDAIEGRGYVDLAVPALPLQEGVFDVSASVVAYDCLHVHDYRKRVLRFDVLNGQPRESGGYVTFGGTWQAPVEAARRP
jgi:ABC-2 type transport system ATP-binding protein